MSAPSLGARSLFALVLLLGACATPEPGRRAAPGDRAAEIYAAVIRHMVAEPGQASGFEVIYVLDHVEPSAGSPEGTGGRSQPIPQERQASISGALVDVGRVQFVSDRQSVVGPMESGARVRKGGILLTLGPIGGVGDRVEVPASSYLANLAGTWQTWVVERRGDGWAVTGTTGPVAVS